MIKKTDHLIWYFNLTYVNNVIRRDEYDMHRRTTGASQYTNTLNKDFFFSLSSEGMKEFEYKW